MTDISFIARGTIISFAALTRDKIRYLSRAIKLISPGPSCDNLYKTYFCLYQSYSEAKIRFYFLIINHLISFSNECKNIVKKIRKQLERCKNKPIISYLFTVADIFLLLAFYHYLFCFFTTDLQSDAIFVFAAGQKTI